MEAGGYFGVFGTHIARFRVARLRSHSHAPVLRHEEAENDS